MTRDQHREIHAKLHQALDALIADFMRHHADRDLYHPYLDMPLRELVDWSFVQTKQPWELRSTERRTKAREKVIERRGERPLPEFLRRIKQ
jgi:hypothetical protein